MAKLPAMHLRPATIFCAFAFAAACTRPLNSPEPATSQTPLQRTTVLPSAALRADLDLLETIYRTLHPGLNRYNTPTEIDAIFANARTEFARDRTMGEAFLVLTKTTASLRCGHSYPNFFNQSAPVAEALLRGPRLPLLFRWLGDRLVVTEDLGTGARLPRGTVIERIGAWRSADLLRELLPFARADGGNDAKRRAYLEVTEDDATVAFHVLLRLVHEELFTANSPLELSVQYPDGRRATIMTSKLEGASNSAKTAVAPNPDAPIWQVERLRHQGRDIAYLRMRSWVMYKTKWAWEAALHQTMADLARDRVPALIVDLRGNEGGNDVGDVILSHLISQPVPRRTTVRRVRFREVPLQLRPVLDTWDKSFFTLGADATPTLGADGWYDLATEDEMLEPATPTYRGKLIVLIDASNSSATFQFSARVKAGKLGTLVGTPTGGSQRGINGGAFFFARLPATGLEVDVPLIGTFPLGPMGLANQVPDTGIEPDVLIEEKPEDVAMGRDAAWETARSLVAN